jgi:hypothetical protein
MQQTSESHCNTQCWTQLCQQYVTLYEQNTPRCVTTQWRKKGEPSLTTDGSPFTSTVILYYWTASKAAVRGTCASKNRLWDSASCCTSVARLWTLLQHFTIRMWWRIASNQDTIQLHHQLFQSSGNYITLILTLRTSGLWMHLFFGSFCQNTKGLTVFVFLTEYKRCVFMSSMEPRLLVKSRAFRTVKINTVVCQVMSMCSLAGCHHHFRKT